MIRVVGIVALLAIVGVIFIGLVLQAVGAILLWSTAAVTVSALIYDFVSLICHKLKRT